LFADYDEKTVDAVVFASEQFFGTYYIIAKVYSVGFKDGAKKKLLDQATPAEPKPTTYIRNNW
jgi:hypothetical protein